MTSTLTRHSPVVPARPYVAAQLAAALASFWQRPIAPAVGIGVVTTLLFHVVVAIARPAYWWSGVWDESFYVGIAVRGYVLTGGDYLTFTNLPFSPGWPLLLRILQSLTGVSAWVLRTPTAGILFVIGCVGLAQVLRRFSPDVARNNRVVLLFALWPPSLYFRSAYSEALYLPLVMFFFVFLVDRRYLAAAILASLATFTRNPGVVLIATLCGAVLLDAAREQPLARALWSATLRLACLVPITLFGFLVYVLWTALAGGDLLAFQRAYDAWSHYHVGPWRSLRGETAADVLALFFGKPTLLAIVTFLGLPLLVFTQRTKLPVVLVLFSAIAWLFFLAQDFPASPYHDMLRWTAVVFPMHFAAVCVLDALPRWRLPAYVLVCGLCAAGLVYFVQRYISGTAWVS
jgi:hypothetical protein